MPDPLDPPPPGPPGPGGHDAPPPDPDLPGAPGTPGARPEAGVGPDPGPDRGQGRWPERGADRYLGGVASGIAHAVDVDPFVVRLGLALGVLYVPQLVVLYTLAWLLLPDERTHRSLLADRGGPHGWPAPVGVAALGIGAAVLAPDLGPGGDPELTFGALLLAMGFMLVTGRVGSTSPPGESRPGPDESVPGVAPQPGSPSFGAGLDDRLPSGSAAGLPASGPGADERVSPGTAGEPSRPGARRAAAPLVSWPPRGAQALRRERAPHQRAYLGWFGISALVVLLVGLAGLDQAWEPVDPGIVVSLCLLLVGAVLCVAGWRGRARLLLPVVVLLVPLWLGWAASGVPRYEGDGSSQVTVGAGQPLPAAVEHGYGTIEVDLTGADFAAGQRDTLRIGLTAGVARIRVPRDVHLHLRGDVGVGAVEVHDGWQVGEHGPHLLDRVDRRLGDPFDHCVETSVYDPSTDPALGEGTDLGAGEGRGPAGDGTDAGVGEETVPPAGDGTDPRVGEGSELPASDVTEPPTIESLVEQPDEEPPDELPAPPPGEPAIEYYDQVTGEPCTPAEPSTDPAELELVLDVGIGNVEVQRV